jgi:hypothetical protein
VNPHREVEVQLGGTAKYIRFTANALCEAEGVLKQSLPALFADEESIKQLGFTQVRALLWAGLRGARGGAGPKWSLEQVGEQMDPAMTGEYLKAIGRALRLATTGKVEPDPPQPAADGAPMPASESDRSTGTA